MFHEAHYKLGEAILRGTRLQAVDVGGACGLIPHWQKFLGNTDFYIYEPHEASCNELRQMYANTPFASHFKVISTALASSGGLKTFYQTNSPTGSSLMKPNTADPRYADDPYFNPVREVLIRTEKLEDSLDIEGAPLIDAIKLDVQGGELDILMGLDKERLSNLLVVELEIILCDAYENAPNLGDIQRFLAEAGLELYDIRCSRSARVMKETGKTYNESVFGTPANSAASAARLDEADVVFFRRAHDLNESGNAAQLKKMVFCLCVYNYFAEAFELVSRSPLTASLPPDERAALPELIKAWQQFNRQIMQDYDNILNAIGHKLWGQYTWTGYPNG